jgi:hypothetical protein
MRKQEGATAPVVESFRLGSGETAAKADARNNPAHGHPTGRVVYPDSPQHHHYDDLGSSPSSGLGSSAGVSE